MRIQDVRYLLILVFYLYRILWTARPEKNPGLLEQQPWMTRLVHFLGPLLLDKTYSVKLYFSEFVLPRHVQNVVLIHRAEGEHIVLII